MFRSKYLFFLLIFTLISTGAQSQLDKKIEDIFGGAPIFNFDSTVIKYYENAFAIKGIEKDCDWSLVSLLGEKKIA